MRRDARARSHRGSVHITVQRRVGELKRTVHTKSRNLLLLDLLILRLGLSLLLRFVPSLLFFCARMAVPWPISESLVRRLQKIKQTLYLFDTDRQDHTQDKHSTDIQAPHSIATCQNDIGLASLSLWLSSWTAEMPKRSDTTCSSCSTPPTLSPSSTT